MIHLLIKIEKIGYRETRRNGTGGREHYVQEFNMSMETLHEKCVVWLSKKTAQLTGTPPKLIRKNSIPVNLKNIIQFLPVHKDSRRNLLLRHR
jgi:hypothetical protein